MRRLQIIDSHTGGEPTRTVIGGGPELGHLPWSERRRVLAEQYDWLRTAVVNEPRGSDVLVGALLGPARDPGCVAGVVFFNNVGYLGMCGHGLIGVVVTLAHLGRIGPGRQRIETPVGEVAATLHDAHRVSVENVASFRHRSAVTVDVPGCGQVTGDVAWGGNWFFLISTHGQRIAGDNTAALTDYCWAVRQALARQGITGRDGAEIDHIELFGPPQDPTADSRNFVLCPGLAYDRSPCGTGTSAKLACLAADGRLPEGRIWRQESVVGRVFEASYRRHGEQVLPQITGRAYVTAEATLLLDPHDPFVHGLRVENKPLH